MLPLTIVTTQYCLCLWSAVSRTRPCAGAPERCLQSVLLTGPSAANAADGQHGFLIAVRWLACCSWGPRSLPLKAHFLQFTETAGELQHRHSLHFLLKASICI